MIISPGIQIEQQKIKVLVYSCLSRKRSDCIKEKISIFYFQSSLWFSFLVGPSFYHVRFKTSRPGFGESQEFPVPSENLDVNFICNLTTNNKVVAIINKLSTRLQSKHPNFRVVVSNMNCRYIRDYPTFISFTNKKSLIKILYKVKFENIIPLLLEPTHLHERHNVARSIDASQLDDENCLQHIEQLLSRQQSEYNPFYVDFHCTDLNRS